MGQNDRLPTVLIVEDFEDSAPTVAGDGGRVNRHLDALLRRG